MCPAEGALHTPRGRVTNLATSGKRWALHVAGVLAALSLLGGPALAQKSGGTATVGLELDIPGFDPLKVGVFDTAAEIRGRPDLRYPHHPR